MASRVNKISRVSTVSRVSRVSRVVTVSALSNGGDDLVIVHPCRNRGHQGVSSVVRVVT
jgi:hypothetical protein